MTVYCRRHRMLGPFICSLNLHAEFNVARVKSVLRFCLHLEGHFCLSRCFSYLFHPQIPLKTRFFHSRPAGPKENSPGQAKRSPGLDWQTDKPWKGDRKACRPCGACFLLIQTPGLRYGATAPSLARGYCLLRLRRQDRNLIFVFEILATHVS